MTKRPLDIIFYKTEMGNEPVREWLRSLLKEERQLIGEDIKMAQILWPLGEPTVKKIESGIWEIRTKLSNRIARIFVTKGSNKLIIMHGFIKKTNKTPLAELEIVRKRVKIIKKGK